MEVLERLYAKARADLRDGRLDRALAGVRSAMRELEAIAEAIGWCGGSAGPSLDQPEEGPDASRPRAFVSAGGGSPSAGSGLRRCAAVRQIEREALQQALDEFEALVGEVAAVSRQTQETRDRLRERRRLHEVFEGRVAGGGTLVDRSG